MKRRLIINADDLGYDPAVTRGILEAMETGGVTSATLMVNTPFSEEAGRLARRRSIGLHLNLARGSALALGREFVEARAGELTADEVERESSAQLDRLEALVGAPATHVDVHKHLHRHPEVLKGLARAAARRGLPVRAIDPGMRQFLRAAGVRVTDAFVGDAGEEAYWTSERLAAALARIGPGVTELMCHPGYRPVAVTSGYAEQREVELRTFAHAAAVAREHEIELIDFGGLHSSHA